jgi:hypothetical protein
MAIIIDPGIRLIPDDQRVFVLHPGERKIFYKEFYNLNSVFLDFPGIDFARKLDSNDVDLRNSLRMSRAIAAWHRLGRDPTKKPSRDAGDYSVKNPAGEKPRYLHEVIDLYEEAKKGDLIVVPGPGYNSVVYIGEFSDNFDQTFKVEVSRYPFDKIPARRVNWLRWDVIKGTFSTRLIALLQNRAAIIEVKQESDRREIYTAAFGNYIWKGSSGNLIRTKHAHIDLNELGNAINLVNYFSAQYLALKDNRLEEFVALEFHEAIERFYKKEFFGSVDVEIHSPGEIGRTMKTATLAAYVSAMLALSANCTDAAEAKAVVVSNSASIVATVCDMELEQEIRQSMEVHANFDIWKQKLCPKRQRAENEVGLEADVKVKKQN